MANLQNITETQNFKVTGYEDGEFGIAVMLKKGDCEVKHLVIKDQFENWLTDGTSEVEYALPELNANNDLTGRMGRMPLDAYWQETEMVIMSDLYSYLTGTEAQRKEVAAAFQLEDNLITMQSMIGLTPIQAASIRIMMYEYGSARAYATISSFSSLLKSA